MSGLCKDCEHWGHRYPFVEGAGGGCARVIELDEMSREPPPADGMALYSPNGGTPSLTGPDFGCVRFKEKQENDERRFFG